MSHGVLPHTVVSLAAKCPTRYPVELEWKSLTSVRVQVARPRAHAVPIGTAQKRQKPVDDWVDSDDEDDDVESEFMCDIRIEQRAAGAGAPHFARSCKAGTISFDSETFEITANMKTSVRAPSRSEANGLKMG